MIASIVINLSKEDSFFFCGGVGKSKSVEWREEGHLIKSLSSSVYHADKT